MKKVACGYEGCGGRRASHDREYVPRGTRHFEVPEGHPGPWFCSIECACYARYDRAERRARELVGMVWGTMGLEGQGLTAASIEEMVQKMTRKLLEGDNAI